jgi:hypothetical protein
MYTPQKTNFLERINKYLSHFDWPPRAQTPRAASATDDGEPVEEVRVDCPGCTPTKRCGGSRLPATTLRFATLLGRHHPPGSL